MEARARQLFYMTVITALCVTTPIAVVVLLSGDFGETDARIVGTALAMVAFSSASLAGFSLRRRAISVVVSYACIAASALGFVAWVNLIWSDSGFDSDGTWKPAVVLLILTVAVTQASLLILGARDTENRSVQAALGSTLAMIVVLSSMLVIALLKEIEDETYYRFLGAVTILWALGTILVPVLRRARSLRVERVTPR
jgi:hypothetical protein